jgi:hypothetical protein
MSTPDSSPASDPSLENSILDILTRAGALGAASSGPGTPSGGPGTLSAPEIAHAIKPDGDWHGLLLPIRRAAVALAQRGRLVIYRKGKPVDPNNFRGVYRLGLPRQD